MPAQLAERRVQPMAEYGFTLAAKGLASTSEAPLSAIEATCHDCLVSSSEEVVRFDFMRDAGSLDEAVGGAVLDLKKAGVGAWLENVEEQEDGAAAA